MSDKSPSVPEPVRDEPDAAAEVYIALFESGPDVTTKALAEKTSIGERAVRNHLETLEELGFAESRPDFSGGARWRYVYSLSDPDPESPE